MIGGSSLRAPVLPDDRGAARVRVSLARRLGPRHARRPSRRVSAGAPVVAQLHLERRSRGAARAAAGVAGRDPQAHAGGVDLFHRRASRRRRAPRARCSAPPRRRPRRSRRLVEGTTLSPPRSVSLRSGCVISSSLGSATWRPSSVRTQVNVSVRSSTRPRTSPISTRSPTRIGCVSASVTPAITFASDWRAANPAIAPTTALDASSGAGELVERVELQQRDEDAGADDRRDDQAAHEPQARLAGRVERDAALARGEPLLDTVQQPRRPARRTTSVDEDRRARGAGGVPVAAACGRMASMAAHGSPCSRSSTARRPLRRPRHAGRARRPVERAGA